MHLSSVILTIAIVDYMVFPSLNLTSFKGSKGVRKQDHITPILKALHWLPVEKRIIFKILLMTYKTLNGLAPSYLKTLITRYHPTRKLRSSSRSTLQVPRVKTSTYGDRAFSSAAPKLWNSLLDHIKSKHTLSSFKSSLKTFYLN